MLNLETLLGISFSQFLLAFARISGLIFTAPIFQSKFVPIQLKILFTTMFAMAIGPFAGNNVELTSFNLWLAVFTLVQELVVGLVIGFVVNITFMAFQLAGFLLDISMGFGMVNVIDPTTGTEMPLLGQFNYFFALLLFLSINGHHTMIFSLIKSYDTISPGMLFLQKEAVGVMVQGFVGLFLLGFKIGLPVMGAIFLSDVALGIIAKLIPQINVFVIGFPIKIMLGLFVLIAFFPVFIMVVEKVFANSGDTFIMLKSMLRELH